MKYDAWNLLQQQGIVNGAMPTLGKTATPWYIQFLTAFASWFASIFIFSAFFVAFSDLISNIRPLLSISVVLLGLAFYCFKYANGQFAKSLGLAASMAAQVLVMLAIFVMKETDAWPLAIKFLTLFGFEMLMIFIMPNFIHALLASIAGVIALSYTFHHVLVPNIVTAIAMFATSIYWQHEFFYSKYMKKMRAIGYGLLFSMVFFAQKTFWGKDFNIILNSSDVLGSQAWLQWLHLRLWWLNDLLMIAVILYTLNCALKYYQKPLKSRESISILVITLLLCVLGIKVPGFNIGVFLIGLGFFVCHSFIWIMGALILVTSMSVYYYNLEMTLLEKSISLLTLGIVLLFLRWLLCKSKIWGRFTQTQLENSATQKIVNGQEL